MTIMNEQGLAGLSAYRISRRLRRLPTATIKVNASNLAWITEWIRRR